MEHKLLALQILERIQGIYEGSQQQRPPLAEQQLNQQQPSSSVSPASQGNNPASPNPLCTVTDPSPETGPSQTLSPGKLAGLKRGLSGTLTQSFNGLRKPPWENMTAHQRQVSWG